MRKLLLFVSFLLLATSIFAQKKPIDHSVYDKWENISSSALSNNGRWINYIISPQEGDGNLILSSNDGKISQSIERGSEAKFTDNSNFLLFKIRPHFKDIRAAKIKKKKANEMPMDSLGIISLKDQSIIKFENIKAYKLPEKSQSPLIAYLVKGATKVDTTDSIKAVKAATAQKSEFNLVLRNLERNELKTFNNVDEFDFNEDGSLLIFIRKSDTKKSLDKKDSLNNRIEKEDGLYLYNVKTQDLKRIKSGEGQYKNITFDKNGKQLAFTFQKSLKKYPSAVFDLYYFNMQNDSALVLVDNNSNGVPKGWSVSGSKELKFSQNGDKLFFGLAPTPPQKDTTLVDFEVADVDIWNWKDDYLQTQQLVNRSRDSSKSYLSVIYPHDSKLILLADESLPNTFMTEDADNEFILATTDTGRRIESQWLGGTFNDIYTVSTITGKRQKIAENVRGEILLSPKGNSVLWFDRMNGNWYSYSVSNQKINQLNKNLDIKFYDEENDMPDEPRSYGVAGWSKEDDIVYIYDRYDIWAFYLDDKSPSLITNGYGRKNKIKFRYNDFKPVAVLRTSRKPVIIDNENQLYLSAFDNKTKESGWFVTSFKKRKDPIKLVMAPFQYNQEKADEKMTVFLYTKENYNQAPDLYISTDFKKERQLSAINKQQDDYNWGSAELFKWKAANGKEAEGILYKPEDFDANKKYPMIVYFYEKLSDGLYNYIAPAPTPSRLNISYFVSNGYLVFTPDIEYEIGYPGKSAEGYINSGVEALKAFPFVDGKHIGIQGQSWGGYQVAHLITRTDMYAAAWSGAPVVNMTSAYGGIRWQSGMNRQFQYERTQTRIGKTLWENPELYIENSPLFHLNKVNTPVVIMANDKDGAVPWYQGIEMFTALRRLGKPVWMLNYNNDEHNLMKRQNRKDIQIREQQFFDHYLKGKPAPVWLEKGVPAVLKGIDWGFDLVD